MECKICNKSFDDKTKHYHHERNCKGIRICVKCGHHIKTSYDKHVNSCDGTGPRNQIPNGKGRGWLKGKTFVDVYGIEKSNDIKNKISLATELKPIYNHTQETKDKISLSMMNNINWVNSTDKSGKCKSGKYFDHYFNSSWELAYIIYNLENNISFKRNKEYFDYVDTNGKSRKYVPDFILDDGTYLEIKGYYTENVGQKLKAFPHNIIVYYEKDMKKYLDYVINKYGKNFVEQLKTKN